MNLDEYLHQLQQVIMSSISKHAAISHLDMHVDLYAFMHHAHIQHHDEGQPLWSHFGGFNYTTLSDPWLPAADNNKARKSQKSQNFLEFIHFCVFVSFGRLPNPPFFFDPHMYSDKIYSF